MGRREYHFFPLLIYFFIFSSNIHIFHLWRPPFHPKKSHQTTLSISFSLSKFSNTLSCKHVQRLEPQLVWESVIRLAEYGFFGRSYYPRLGNSEWLPTLLKVIYLSLVVSRIARDVIKQKLCRLIKRSTDPEYTLQPDLQFLTDGSSSKSLTDQGDS